MFGQINSAILNLCDSFQLQKVLCRSASFRKMRNSENNNQIEKIHTKKHRENDKDFHLFDSTKISYQPCTTANLWFFFTKRFPIYGSWPKPISPI